MGYNMTLPIVKYKISLTKFKPYDVSDPDAINDALFNSVSHHWTALSNMTLETLKLYVDDFRLAYANKNYVVSDKIRTLLAKNNVEIRILKDKSVEVCSDKVFNFEFYSKCWIDHTSSERKFRNDGISDESGLFTCVYTCGDVLPPLYYQGLLNGQI